MKKGLNMVVKRTYQPGKPFASDDGYLSTGCQSGTITYDVSPRGPDGKLVLRANALNQRRELMRAYSQGTYTLYGKKKYTTAISASNTLLVTAKWPSYSNGGVALDNHAHARFMNKVNMGATAGLGITLAEYSKTAKMLRSRLTHTSNLLKKRIKVLKSKRGRRETKKRLRELEKKYGVSYRPADLYLEGLFGWGPLFQSVFDSAFVLTGARARGPAFVRSSATREESNATVATTTSRRIDTIKSVTRFRTCEAAQVFVENPNVWLASRLGLNPLAVGWDAIPWSFVVNMFVNVDQVIKNYEPMNGIILKNVSVTRTAFTTLDWAGASRHTIDMPGGGTGYSYVPCSASWVNISKGRSLTSLSYKLQVRLPTADLTLAGIFASLVAQRAKKITRFVDRLRSK